MYQRTYRYFEMQFERKQTPKELTPLDPTKFIGVQGLYRTPKSLLSSKFIYN